MNNEIFSSLYTHGSTENDSKRSSARLPQLPVAFKLQTLGSYASTNKLFNHDFITGSDGQLLFLLLLYHVTSSSVAQVTG